MRPRMILACLMTMAISVMTSNAFATDFPQELQGTWDLGPEPCQLPVNPDSDSPIKIKARIKHAYEHVEKPVYVKRASNKMKLWVISTEADNASGIVVFETYVLNGDHLTITDGETTMQYRRCS